MFLTIITFIVVLGLLVLVHELGHFAVAKLMGVKVEEFGFGFPPRSIGVQRVERDGKKKWRIIRGSKEVPSTEKGGTIYSLNWIPIGGFVKLLGQDDFSVAGNMGDENPQNFRNKKPWQRFSILSAGVAMNVLLCAVLLSAGFMFGLPQVLGEEQTGNIRDYKIQVVEVLDDYPAQEAGLEMGDIIASVEGTSFSDLKNLQGYLNESSGQELTFQIKRGEELLEKKMTPKLLPKKEDQVDLPDQAGVGVALVESALVSYPWHEAISRGFTTTGYLTKEITFAFGRLFKDIFTTGKVSPDIAGPVGIAVITGRVASLGFIYLLQFTALLSLNLAILNFLPFPALDGGHVIFLLIEKIRRKPNNRKIEAIINTAGFALLMLLVLLVTFRDVKTFLWDKIVGLF